MIPQQLKQKLLQNPYYKKCARNELLHDHECHGRITFEHVFMYAGRQIQEEWAIIPLCQYAHSVLNYQDNGILDKKINERIALMRATDDDFKKYPKRDWKRLKKYRLRIMGG